MGNDPHGERQRVHASCVSLDGKGILISGASGCGKSDLALRLMEVGASLIADDYVDLDPCEDGRLLVRCPDPLRGLLEVRHIGVVRGVDYLESAPLCLYLRPSSVPQRMPDPEWLSLLGVRIPCLELPYFEGSVVAKIRLFLRQGIEVL